MTESAPAAQTPESAYISTPTRGVLPLMLIAMAGAIALRIVEWLALRHAFFSGVPGFGDLAHYDRIQALLAAGFPESRIPWGSPLYPYAGAFLSTVFGADPARIFIAQAIFGVATVPLVAWSLAPLLGPRARWIAALIYGLHPLGAFFELRLQPIVFAVILLLLAMRLLFLSGAANRSRLLFGGAVLGLGFLFQPWLFFAVAVAAAWYQRHEAIRASDAPARGRALLRAPALVLAGFIVLPALSCVYNSTTPGGGPTWNWSDAYAFHRNLSSETWGAARATQPPIWDGPEIASREGYEAMGRRLSEWDLASFYRGRGLQQLVENPLRLIGSALLRAAMMISRPEIPDPVSARDVFGHSLRIFRWALYLFPAYLTLALIGLLRRRRFPAGLLAIIVAAAAANILGTFSAASRWFFVVAILPLAAIGIESLPDVISHAGRDRRARFALLIAIGAGVISFVDVPRGAARYENPGEDLRYRAQLAARLGNRSEATSLLMRAVTIDPRNAAAHVELGALLKQEDLPVRAREELATALEIDPQNDAALYTLAEIARQENRYAEAESLAAQLVQQHPQHPLYLNEYGVILMMQGKFAAARFLFNQALQIEPDYQVAQMNLRATDEGERDAPSLAFPPEMLPEPGSPLVQQGQAALLALGQGNWKAADSLTALLLSENPSTPLAWFLRGSFLYRAGHAAEAAQLLTRVVEQAPGRALTTESAARALAAAGRRADAQALAERSLAQAPDERNRASIERLLGLIRDPQSDWP